MDWPLLATTCHLNVCGPSVPGSVNVPASDTSFPTKTDWSGPAFAAGGTLFTVIENNSASLRLGEPLSVTRTVTLNDAGPSAGVKLNAPVAELIAAPAGAPGSRLNVR